VRGEPRCHLAGVFADSRGLGSEVDAANQYLHAAEPICRIANNILLIASQINLFATMQPSVLESQYLDLKSDFSYSSCVGLT
jgi:hypothetical protein